ncbi:MAG: NAD-dependent epimerase/dehydratase family protein [Actinomycetota bacterium]
MRAFVTGGTGFVGGHLARKLRERGDDVVALVRSPQKATQVRELGCEIVQGDLSDEDVIRKAVVGCDAVFHVAAMYEVGIPEAQQAAMYDANVKGTERVIDATVEAGVPKMVYVSTIGVFGDTHGQTVDETFHREPTDFMSYYEETKYFAHELAKDRVAKGAPIVIVQPGGIYGPNDPSILGIMMKFIRKGMLPVNIMPRAGFNWVYVEDVADGIILAHERGKIGESYVLGGEIANLKDAIARISRAAGRKPPRLTIPDGALKLGLPFGRIVSRLTGLPSNMREMLRNVGATFYASDAKARAELGYSPRDLDTGLTQTLAAG